MVRAYPESSISGKLLSTAAYKIWTESFGSNPGYVSVACFLRSGHAPLGTSRAQVLGGLPPFRSFIIYGTCVSSRMLAGFSRSGNNWN